MNRAFVASATVAALLVASFATTASAANVSARPCVSPSYVGSAQVSHRHMQKHPFYRSWGNHYGFGPGHHQY